MQGSFLKSVKMCIPNCVLLNPTLCIRLAMVKAFTQTSLFLLKLMVSS